MMHILFLVTLAFIASVITWLEWPSLVHVRMKAVFLFLVAVSYCLGVMILLNPSTPGPFQLWEYMVGPFLNSWLPS
ncbi:hypothetical protein D3C84_1081240 [compost metagenome]